MRNEPSRPASQPAGTTLAGACICPDRPSLRWRGGGSGASGCDFDGKYRKICARLRVGVSRLIVKKLGLTGSMVVVVVGGGAL